MRVRKFPIFILIAVLIFQSSVLAIGDEYTEETQNYSDTTINIIEDAPIETEEIEISPIDPEFYKNKEGAIAASPLTIHHEDEGRERSRAYLPAYYSLVENRRTTPVRDQGPNGSCWAFATFGSLESTLTTMGYYDLAEKHMRNTHGFDWGPNDGGNRDISAAYLSRWSGPIWEKDDPYDPYGYKSPENLPRAFDLDKVLFVPDIRNNDTSIIKQYLMEYGAMYTTVDGNQGYDSTTYNSHYDGGRGRGNHAVTIVGWDDNFSRYNFRMTAPGNGAWIVKNSWGPNFLANGYYYVSYYDGVMGTSNAQFFAKRKDNTGNIYYYDKLGATRSVGYRGEGYMANVFKANRNEMLNQVGLFNVATNTSYKVYLVKNVRNTSDFYNNRIEVASGRMGLPGYYTVDTKRYELKYGEQFAIVVYMSNGNYSYPLAIESPVRYFASYAYANRGESFYSSNGSSWKDLTNDYSNANCCIKAITTTSGTPNPDPAPTPDPEPTPDPDEEDPIEPIEPEEPTVVKVTGVTLNHTNGWLYKGRYGQLKATVYPENAANKKVRWYSSNSRICSVNQNGRIYGVYPGTAIITVYTEDGYYKATCRVNVKSSDYYYYYDDGSGDKIEDEDNPYPTPDPEVLITEIEILDGDEAYLPIDKVGELETRFYPENATNKNLVQSAASGGRVCLPVKGQLIPKKLGKEIIKVTSPNGKVEKNITVHIVKPGEKLNGLNAIKVVGENKDYVIDDEVTPDDNNNINELQDILLNKKSDDVYIGREYDLKKNITLFPLDAEDVELTYSSNDTSVATVDENGIVRGLRNGSATIIIENKNKVRAVFTANVSYNKDDVKIDDIRVEADAKRNWFTHIYKIKFKVDSIDKSLSGTAKLTLRSGDKEIEKTVTIRHGAGEIKIGWEFPRWYKDFTGTISFNNFVKDFEFTVK